MMVDNERIVCDLRLKVKYDGVDYDVEANSNCDIRTDSDWYIIFQDIAKCLNIDNYSKSVLAIIGMYDFIEQQ